MVSIIMPVFNNEDTLAEAIQSVIHQRYAEWELLVIDNNSTDGSPDIIAAFSDKRIRKFEEKQQGVSAARNKGLEEMKGAYFCFLDADDLLPPTSIELRINVLKENPHVAFVDGSVKVVEENSGKIINTFSHQSTDQIKSALLRIDEAVFTCPSWLIRRDKEILYKFKDGLTHGEDLLFFLTYADQGSYHAISAVTYIYRRRKESAMANLEGLESGYKVIINELNHMDISEMEIDQFRKKTRSIMVKSYLAAGKPLKAWNAYRTF